MSVQEFVSGAVRHHKQPTPSASTPYRQLKRHHSLQVAAQCQVEVVGIILFLFVFSFSAHFIFSSLSSPLTREAAGQPPRPC